MTTTRQREEVTPPAARGRERLKRVLITIGLLIGLVIVGISGYWALARSGAVDTPTITQVVPQRPDFASGPTTAPAPTSPVADGCLGGPGTNPAATVLAAQAAAPLTPEGAAGFALAVARYQGTYPGDLQLPTVVPQIIHPSWVADALPKMEAHTATLAALGGVSGTVPAAADAWRIVAADPSNASISVGFVIYLGQQGSPKMAQSAGTMVLDVINGRWTVAAVSAPPADPLAPIAGADWHSFAGVC